MLQIQINNQLFAVTGSLVVSSGLPTPLLVIDVDTSTISWSVSGPAPAFALVEQSSNGGATWTTLSTPAWGTGSLQVPADQLYRVTGLNGIMTPVTTVSNTVSNPAPNAITSDWVSRVISNGAASPSLNTIAAVNTFANALDSAGITSLIKENCLFVPDSLIASTTPLIRNNGNDPWTNSNFVGGDLTVYGLRGNGSNKSLQSGVIPFTWSGGIGTGSDYHMSAYVQGNLGGGCEAVLGTSRAVPTTVVTRLYYCSELRCSFTTTDLVVPAQDSFRGYICGSLQGGATPRNFYIANSGLAHGIGATDNNGSAIGPSAVAIPIFASDEGGALAVFANKRLSYVSFGLGLTQAQSLAHYNAIVALRTQLGGGLDTDPNIV